MRLAMLVSIRVQIFSDLHLEFGPADLATTDAEVIILAGDIAPGLAGLETAHSIFSGRPVVYVAGNHEYYGQALPQLTDDLKAAARGTHVHFLENQELILQGVRFLGATLWTDFGLFGETLREAATDVAPPVDDGAPVEARAAQPSVEEVARVFLRLADLAARCAEGEGPGEFRVSASVRGSDGRVRDVTVTTGFSDRARQCVQNLAAGMSFPPFGDETASFEHTFTVSGEADAGTDDGGVSIAQEVRRILRRAAPQARACVPGVEGAVVLLVRVDGTAQTATLVSVEGAVTAEQQECLRNVVEATEVPSYPGTWTVPLTLQ